MVSDRIYCPGVIGTSPGLDSGVETSSVGANAGLAAILNCVPTSRTLPFVWCSAAWPTSSFGEYIIFSLR